MQTDRQTDPLIAILRTSPGSEVKTTDVVKEAGRAVGC